MCLLSAAWRAVPRKMRAIAPCWRYPRHRPKHAATHLPPAGPPAYAEVLRVFCSRRQLYRHASVLELPPQSYGHRQASSKALRREDILATVQIKPGIFKLPRCASAELVFSCCGSVAALALANWNEHVAEAAITTPARTQRVLHGAQSSRGQRG
jgi:hypothetical protein